MSDQRMQPFDPVRWGLQAYRNGSAPRASDSDSDDDDECDSDVDSDGEDGALVPHSQSNQAVPATVEHIHNPVHKHSNPEDLVAIIEAQDKVIKSQNALICREFD
jgi:hypothetical protein